MKRRYIKEYLDQRGFTILETLVAIFILAISITGPMSFAQSGLRTAFLARDQITAFYLAQDAIETIRNIRDQNELDCGSGPGVSCFSSANENNWIRSLAECRTVTTRPCSIDTTFPDPGAEIKGIKTCAGAWGGDCPALKFNDVDGTFGTENGTEDSIFSRTIYMNEKKEEQEVEIIVVVSWKTNAGLGRRQVIVQQNLFNWFVNDSS